jgi:hypothetical protein
MTNILKWLLIWEVTSAGIGFAFGGAWPWILLWFPNAPDPMHLKNAMHAAGLL